MKLESTTEFADLGSLLSEHSGAKAGQRDLTTGSIILIGLASFAGLVMLTQPGPILVLIGVLGAGMVAYMVPAIRNLGRRVEVRERGMVVHDGGNHVAFRWDEIASLTGMLPMHSSGQPIHLGGPLTIRLNDGQKFRFGSGIERLDALANLAYEKLLGRLDPTLQSIQRGESVDFGMLKVDRTGLGRGEQFLNWRDFQRVAFTADDLVILKRETGQPWLKVRLNQVDNANILVQISQTLRAA
jgi:hypothetical protein